MNRPRPRNAQELLQGRFRYNYRAVLGDFFRHKTTIVRTELWEDSDGVLVWWCPKREAWMPVPENIQRTIHWLVDIHERSGKAITETLVSPENLTNEPLPPGKRPTE